MNKILLLIFIIIVFIFGGLLYVYNPEPTEYKSPNPISATSTPASEQSPLNVASSTTNQ